TICNRHFPAGTTVSMNAWAMHYDPTIFPEPEKFMPDRWLDADDDTDKTSSKLRMQEAYFPFGLGSRTCIGRNIATLVILTALPRLVERFDVEMKGDVKEKGLPVQNIFLIRATDFPGVVSVRGE
ncbi:hypothetical protein CERZMDRAFT_40428, partial [Cercospora zeae-maydis SCOH1-5]